MRRRWIEEGPLAIPARERLARRLPRRRRDIARWPGSTPRAAEGREGSVQLLGDVDTVAEVLFVLLVEVDLHLLRVDDGACFIAVAVSAEEVLEP